MGMNFYHIHRLLEEDMTRIIATKPWRLGAYSLLVRTWKSNFAVEEEALKKVTAIWINISFLPVEYHTPKTLISLGNLLAKTIALDARSSTKIYQVRICIETYLNVNLPN